jgi:hypothetical protein
MPEKTSFPVFAALLFSLPQTKSATAAAQLMALKLE